MNKIFKVIWNHATQSWVAVSEYARVHCKSGSYKVDGSKSTNVITQPFTLSALSLSIIMATSILWAQSASATTHLNGNTNGIGISSSSSQQATASDVSNIAIGVLAKADGSQSLAIGSANQSNGINRAYAKAGQSLAIGAGSHSLVAQSTAIGNDVATYGTGSVAIGGDDTGNSNQNKNTKATTLQFQDKNTAAIATRDGTNSATEDDNYRATFAGGRGSVAIGSHTQAIHDAGTAIGAGAISGSGSATGSVRFTTSNPTFALTQNTGVQATAIGAQSWSYGNYTTAIGARALAGLDKATAIGFESLAYSSNSIAIGNQAKSGATSATQTESSGDNTIAIGNNAIAAASNSITMGTNSNVTGSYSVAMGAGNNVSNSNVLVLGNNITTTTDNSVFLGNKAAYVADSDSTKGLTAYPSDTIVGKTVAFAGKVAGVVSVGDVNAERRIQNVSPGLISATSTDAINGSQLYSVANALNKQNYFHVNPATTASTAGNTSNLDYVDGIGGASGGEAVAAGVSATASGRSAVAMGRGATADSLANIAIGENAQATTADKNTNPANKDAASGINKAIAIGSGAQATHAKTIAIGDQANASGRNASAIGSQASVSGTESTGIGVAASVTGDYATGIGQRVRAVGAQSTAIGTWALTDKERSTAIGRSSTAVGNRAVSLGSDVYAVANFTVAAGAYSRATEESAIALGRGANANTLNSSAMGRSATAIGTSAVAIGDNALAGSEAVKNAYNTAYTEAYTEAERTIYDEGVARLVATNPRATEAQKRTAGNNEVANRQLEVITAAKTAAKAKADEILATAGTRTGENTVAIGKNAVAEYKDNVALGAGSKETSATVTDPASLGTINSADVRGITYSGFAASSPTSVVSIGAKNSERRLINVAAGKIDENSTDAINGSQLYAALNQSHWKLATSQDG
ncbi:MAG: ESPR-type extended signal peptide-containing protein, partial [Lonepinella koalarum]|nr:ESPR-type extended signal peptide-containing protein [Lonepinella koalarum]